MTNDELDTAVAAKTFPKVTPQRIEEIIDGEAYFQHGTLTICVLTLANGFKVTGESACVDPRNFEQEIGEGYARKNAVAKIWALEGYALAERQLQERLDGIASRPTA